MMPKISQQRHHVVKRIEVDHVAAPKKASKGLSDHANVKGNGDRSLERTKQIAHEFLEEYLHDSSLHGVKYLSNLYIRSNILGKLFWAATMICSFLFLCWMINTFWNRYNADPIRTVIKSFQSPIFMIPFPAITLCPLIPPLVSRRREVLGRLRLPYNMDNETAMFLLKYGHAFSQERVPGGKDYVSNLKALLKLNHISLITLLKSLRPCEDLFESCWWDGVKKNCSSLFKTSFAYTGVCCSFNYFLEDSMDHDRSERKIKFLKTPLFGPTSGLTVALHRDLLVEEDGTGDVIRFSTNSLGVLVFCHHPQEYIGAIAPRHLLQEREELRIAIIPLAKKKLNGYYRPNKRGELKLYCVHEHSKLKYFPVYLYTNCFISCSIQIVLKLCHCLPFYYEPMAVRHSLRICGWEDFECLYANADAIRVIHDIDEGNFTCQCQTPCKSLHYETQSSTAVLNGQDFNVSPIHKNITRAQAILKVYMNSDIFTTSDTIPIADELYLLASMGGIFSLFVGCSFISVVEIFYFIGLFLHSYYNSMKSRWIRNKTAVQ